MMIRSWQIVLGCVLFFHALTWGQSLSGWVGSQVTDSIEAAMLLFQPSDVRYADEVRLPDAVRGTQEYETREGGQERRRFEQRFNQLVDALTHFASAYNQGHGQVWPHKQAEAVRKAYRDLGRTPLLKGQPPIFWQTETLGSSDSRDHD